MLRFRWRALLLAVTFVTCSSASLAAALPSGFLPAPGRKDIAYDTAHEVLYISGDSTLRRFDMKAGKFLAPIVLGGTTAGMDISPDGKTLAVANLARGASKNYVDLVSLDSLSTQRVGFDLDYDLEGGTFATAFDKSGKLLVSSQFQGSGRVPLRKYDPVSRTTTALAYVSQNSMLSPSADHTYIAIAEQGSSRGPYGRYTTGDTFYSTMGEVGSGPWEIGVSRDGSQLAIVSSFQATIVDATHIIPPIDNYLFEYPLGVAYSPFADILYLPFANTNLIASFDTNTGTLIQTFSTSGTFDPFGNEAFAAGRTKVVRGGSLLLSTLDDGVFIQVLGAPVPEPATALLAAAGLGLLWLRRRA